MRSLRFGLIFAGGEVRFPNDADELYHMRRIWFTVVNFPDSLDFDIYLNHPAGASPIWTPFFDWSIAALARGVVGPGDQHAVEVVATWVPPLLGATAVVVAAQIARRTFSPAAGWVTGALLATLPAHIIYTRLGEVDHHGAVGLCTTLLVAAAMRLAERAPGQDWRRGVGATGFAAAVAILIWPASLLHVATLQVFLVVQALLAAEQSAAVARSRALAAMHGVAALAVAPFSAGRHWEQFGSVSPVVLSNFQPLWFGSACAVLALVGGLWAHPVLGADRARRLGVALLLALGGLSAAWLWIPGLAMGVGEAAEWFEDDPFLAIVAELQPLLFVDGRFAPASAHAWYGHLIWFYPAAAGWLAWRAIRSRNAAALLLLAWSAVFCGASLYQLRFSDAFAASFAVVLGSALAEGFRLARRGLEGRRRVAWFAALAVVAATGLTPHAVSYARDVRASWGALRGRELHYSLYVRKRRVIGRVADWLRAESEPTRGYLDPSLRPEYGILSSWDHGHQLRYYAERPMVQDNFGPYAGRSGFDLAGAYYASRDEQAAVEIARRLGVRYVVATPEGSGQAPPEAGSLARRLQLARASPRTLTFRAIAANAHSSHRLVFYADDGDFVREPGRPVWRAAVYEVVPGARVIGRAPGARSVGFRLAVRLAGRPAVLYRASAAVDAEGRYEIRLPYPTTRTAYVVRSGEQVARLELSEADVMEGRTVEGPSFGEEAGTPP